MPRVRSRRVTRGLYRTALARPCAELVRRRGRRPERCVFAASVAGLGPVAIAAAPACHAASASGVVCVRVRLRAERDDVGELGDRRQVADRGEPGEAERVHAVAGEQGEVGVVDAAARGRGRSAGGSPPRRRRRRSRRRRAVAATRRRRRRGARARSPRPRRVAARLRGGARRGAPAGRVLGSSPSDAASGEPDSRTAARSARARVRASRADLGERGRRGGDGARDVLGRVGERREPRLELRRRGVDAAREQAATPGRVRVEVAGLRALVVRHRLGAEEHA